MQSVGSEPSAGALVSAINGPPNRSAGRWYSPYASTRSGRSLGHARARPVAPPGDDFGRGANPRAISAEQHVGIGLAPVLPAIGQLRAIPCRLPLTHTLDGDDGVIADGDLPHDRPDHRVVVERRQRRERGQGRRGCASRDETASLVLRITRHNRRPGRRGRRGGRHGSGERWEALTRSSGGSRLRTRPDRAGVGRAGPRARQRAPTARR
jgi:hypothetical protein